MLVRCCLHDIQIAPGWLACIIADNGILFEKP